jgi:hypothetical protein
MTRDLVTPDALADLIRQRAAQHFSTGGRRFIVALAAPPRCWKIHPCRSVGRTDRWQSCADGRVSL